MKSIACLALVLVVACDKTEAPPKAQAAASPVSATAASTASPAEQACESGCKHVIACGVPGTFDGCRSECAQNLANNSLTLEQIAAITTADCGTVKANVRLASGGTAGTDLCSTACRNFERCRLQPFDACVKECPGVRPDRLEMYAAASCEQLRSGDFGSQGYGCLREGKQDCQVGMMCCVDHRASRPGEQGSCLYAALCYHRGF